MNIKHTLHRAVFALFVFLPTLAFADSNYTAAFRLTANGQVWRYVACGDTGRPALPCDTWQLFDTDANIRFLHAAKNTIYKVRKDGTIFAAISHFSTTTWHQIGVDASLLTDNQLAGGDYLFEQGQVVSTNNLPLYKASSSGIYRYDFSAWTLISSERPRQISNRIKIAANGFSTRDIATNATLYGALSANLVDSGFGDAFVWTTQQLLRIPGAIGSPTIVENLRSTGQSVRSMAASSHYAYISWDLLDATDTDFYLVVQYNSANAARSILSTRSPLQVAAGNTFDLFILDGGGTTRYYNMRNCTTNCLATINTSSGTTKSVSIVASDYIEPDSDD